MLLLPFNQHGSYVICDSDTKRGEYTLSVRDGDTVKHYRICQLDQRGFYIDRQSVFADLADLVAHYERDADGLCVNLKKSCMRPELPELQLPQTVNQWEIPRSSIKLKHKLGQGQFGEVFEALWNNTTRVAVKTLTKGLISKDTFLEEAQIMKKLHHPNIVKLYAVCTIGEPIYIVMELMRHGSLLDYLHGDGRALKMPQLIDIAAQIAAGMAYLEAEHYIHCDLAARNVLVGDTTNVLFGERLVVKVSDFSLAHVLVKDVYEVHTGAKFPIRWTAPEAAFYNKYSVKSDVWSFGILLTELVTYGRIPYPGLGNINVLNQIELGYRMPQPHGCPDRLYDMMLKCWKEVDMERPTFETLQWQLEEFYSEDGIGGRHISRTLSQM